MYGTYMDATLNRIKSNEEGSATVKRTLDDLTSQAAGAYGERVTEAELLRRGWIAANVNASIRNAAIYDVLAQKGGYVVMLRVRTCPPHRDKFEMNYNPQFIEKPARLNDFTVLVKMGSTRRDDYFYVVPTREVHGVINEIRKWNDSKGVKDINMVTLHLLPLKKKNREHLQYDFAEKWKMYLEGWPGLEEPAPAVE
jgi:hypothetical protein